MSTMKPSSVLAELQPASVWGPGSNGTVNRLKAFQEP